MGKPVRCDINPYGGRGRRGRIGLLGGSFNPAHAGHRHIALAALHRMKLDAVWFMVSPQNPLKSAVDMASLAQRLASARSITESDCRLLATNIETRLGTRYTADTLKKLKQRYPLIDFVWIMGADNLLQLPQWRHWRMLPFIMPMVVVARAPFNRVVQHCTAAQFFRRWKYPVHAASSLIQASLPAWIFLPIRLHPASSTAIRNGRKTAIYDVKTMK